MYVNSVQNSFETVGEGSEYQTNLSQIVNNTGISDTIKNNARNMNKTVIETLDYIAAEDFKVSCYFIIVIAIMLVIFGVYFIKNENCKNYVGTALIVAACILLAFTAIIGFSVLK